MFRQLFVAVVMALVFGGAPLVAHADPSARLPTASIGWIDPSDIECHHDTTSSCVVKDFANREPIAFTFVSQHSREIKYRVRAGTELRVLKYTGDVTEDHNGNWIYSDLVEVGIVNPAEFIPDDPNGGLRHIDPTCHLQKSGRSPQFVSLACRKPSSPAVDKQECKGILKTNHDGDLWFEFRPEGICQINKSETGKVLAQCTPAHFCRVYGVMEDCKDSGECSEITKVLRVTRTK